MYGLLVTDPKTRKWLKSQDTNQFSFEDVNQDDVNQQIILSWGRGEEYFIFK